VSGGTFGTAGLAFVVFAGVLLPLAASAFALGERRRDATRSVDEPRADAAELSRLPLYAQALFTHALLLLAAIGAARVERVAVFRPIEIGWRGAAAAVATLAAVLALGELSWRSRSSLERDRLWVRRILPRTNAERSVWVFVSAGAAVAEEVAYRGVFVALAATATGSPTLAVLAAAVAFAAVHAPQGLAGVGYVFVIALLQHTLVWFTGTLLLAIVVHFAYDVLAGLWLARRHGLTKCCVLRAACCVLGASRGF
jgi:membrane protease YdiL (CAAX protease family)